MTSRKKTLVLFVVAILVILVGYGVSQYSTKKPLKYEAPGSSLVAFKNSQVTGTQAEDSDSDGLTNWEEVLWKTDPNNSDTDGDKTPDGEEVKLNRDPTQKGPNDALEKIDSSVAEGTQELTATQKLAREVLATYIKLKQDEELGTTDAPSVETVLERSRVKITAPQYSLDRFTETSNTIESVREYEKNFFSVFAKHFPSDKPGELQILSVALQKNDPKMFAELKTIATSYRNATADLLLIAVPKSALTLHKNSVNAFSLFAESIEVMSNTYKDPAAGMQGLTVYKDISSIIVKQMKDLDSYFNQAEAQSTAP